MYSIYVWKVYTVKPASWQRAQEHINTMGSKDRSDESLRCKLQALAMQMQM